MRIIKNKTALIVAFIYFPLVIIAVLIKSVLGIITGGTFMAAFLYFAFVD